jgi:hypothetical protein
MLAGELKVAAYADLGGLGARQGPQIPFVWRLPNLLPVLLPWLIVLALLALPSNRNLRAWWIWAPLVCLALLGVGLETVAEASNDEVLGYFIQGACAAAFGLASIWLVGSALSRRCRALAIMFSALAFAAVSLLAFVVGPAGEQLSSIIQLEPAALLYLVLFWVAGGLVFAGALNLTGWRCRRRYSHVRVLLWLPVWLWAIWIVAGSVFGCAVTLTSGGGFEWMGVLVASIVLTLVSFAVVAPYLILSFSNSLYGDRLKDLLRLPATEAASTVVASAPLAERQVTNS